MRWLLMLLGFWIGSCALAAAVWGASDGAVAASRPVLQHVPDEPSQARAERMVREVYGKELGSREAGVRRELAQRMIGQAMESGDDAAARFVLLREARDVAAGAGDAFLAKKAIGVMGKYYAVGEMRMVLGAMNNALAAAGSAEGQGAVAQVCLGAVDRAILEDDYATATKLMNVAEAAAGKTKNARLGERVKERSKQVAAVISEYQTVEKERERLKRDGEDAEACARVGRFLCLYKGDWNGGLPLIAKGAESGLKNLAREDLAASGDARRRLAVGDGWWELGQNQPWLARRHLQERAAWWYRQLPGELNGIHRSIVDKRIEAVELEKLAEQDLTPGLGVELFKGMDFRQCVKRRVDEQINFDWGADAPDAAVGKDNFGMRWSGVIRPPGAGNYELVVLANTGVRLWVDEKLLVENGNLARMRNGVRVKVQFEERLHGIRVEYWDTSGTARMKLLWRRPGAAKDEVVPAAVFFHEGPILLLEGP